MQFVQVLDSNASGGLTSQEFCAAMKKLVNNMKMTGVDLHCCLDITVADYVIATVFD